MPIHPDFDVPPDVDWYEEPEPNFEYGSADCMSDTADSPGVLLRRLMDALKEEAKDKSKEPIGFRPPAQARPKRKQARPATKKKAPGRKRTR